MNVLTTKRLHAVAPILALLMGGLAGSLAADAGTAISAGKLATNAKDYYGKTVTVKAEVEDVIDSRTFTLDEDAILGGADVLVIVPAGYTGTLARDQVVKVTGKVRPYVVAELERDYDWFKGGAIVSRHTEVDFKTRPVLVAESLRTADGRQILVGHTMSTTYEHPGHGTMISAGKLAKDGKKFYGRNVTVRAEVEDVIDSHSFTLDEDLVLIGADVLVLVPAGFDTTNLRKDEVVIVTGKVRPYVVTELERDFDWFKDGKIVTTKTKVDYKTRPVLVAETIRTVDNRDLLTSR
jgi:hypothetical protein